MVDILAASCIVPLAETIRRLLHCRGRCVESLLRDRGTSVPSPPVVRRSRTCTLPLLVAITATCTRSCGRLLRTILLLWVFQLRGVLRLRRHCETATHQQQ